jgi:hypothetical protein
VRDCYSDPKRGKRGHLPCSENALRERIRAGLIPVTRLGPRLHCLTRKTIKDIQANGLPTA